MSDPVLWAKAFVVTHDPATKKLGAWIARDYQEKMLRDRSINKVYRCGRRIGKCLPGWIEVVDPFSGQLYTVEELYKRGTATVFTVREDNFTIVPQSECPVFSNGIKPVYRLTTDDGNYIDATENHPFYTPQGWKELGKIKNGEFIAVPKQIPCHGSVSLTDKELEEEADKIRRGTISPRVYKLNEQSLTVLMNILSHDNVSGVVFTSLTEEIIRRLKHLL